MDDEVIHRADEFANLPWGKLTPGGAGRDWGFGRGGYGLNGESWRIDIFEGIPGKPGFVTHTWELPHALSEAVTMVKVVAQNETERKIKAGIRSALGLDDD